MERGYRDGKEVESRPINCFNQSHPQTDLELTGCKHTLLHSPGRGYLFPSISIVEGSKPNLFSFSFSTSLVFLSSCLFSRILSRLTVNRCQGFATIISYNSVYMKKETGLSTSHDRTYKVKRGDLIGQSKSQRCSQTRRRVVCACVPVSPARRPYLLGSPRC